MGGKKENYGIRPTKTRRGIPVKGLIAAGEPLEISHKPDEWIDLGGDLEGKDVYALKVKGKSMIEDGIYDGDYVIVRRQNACEYGEIIVAVHKSTPSSATLPHTSYASCVPVTGAKLVSPGCSSITLILLLFV